MADTDLIERVNVIAGLLVLSPEQSEALMDAATALAEKDARIAQLEAELEASRFAERNGKSLAEDSIHAIRELLKTHGVPVAAFIDDHVGNAIAQRDASRAECEGLRAALESCAALLETMSEDAELHGDIASWSLASVMAADARAALSQKETGA